ncbi:GspH/FimT family pseudopilin [Reinekea marinisedimentorum]|uniref:Type II secretion system protein H n=1 Tax=Reinekea marinisedimentorum TaxID=230495 RepID=A0A4R3HV95_9GAMM|nr:GspH/FimT family pseudopilin [Reinekea marinisedimentorum]TCS36443.1 type IV fimbrial biogenesis protein FimT [Reinekea marinisedimentorum]
MKSVRGFTIVELMVTLVILAIITMAAAPSFNNVIRSSRIDSNLSKIRAGYSFARTEAGTRQEGVSICVANSSLDDCATGTDWSGGWIVFTDTDNDIVYETSDGDTLLRIWEGVSDDFSLTGSASGYTFYDNGAAVEDPYSTSSFTSMKLTLTPDSCPTGESLIREFSVVSAFGGTSTTTGTCP